MHMGRRKKNIVGHIFIVETLLLILTFPVYCARVTLNSLYIKNVLLLKIILRNEKKAELIHHSWKENSNSEGGN